MGESFRMVSRLALIALVAGLFLGGTYYITKEPIAEQERMQAQQARQEVLPAAQDFEKLDFQKTDTIEEIYAGKANGETVGYTVKLISKGYGGDIVMTVGVNGEGITGVKINSHSETPGLGAKADAPGFMNQTWAGPPTLLMWPRVRLLETMIFWRSPAPPSPAEL